MQAKEQSISDATLIERLRHYAQIAHAAAAWGFAGEGEVMSRAADRIEQLVATNEALLRREEKLGVLLSAAGSVADAMKDRAEAAEARADAMRQAVQHANDHADAAIADMEAMKAERDALKEHVADLLAEQECGCGYDRPTDVCLGHLPLHHKTVARAEQLAAKCERLEEALIWCSGSADFNEGGIAREGWLKLCAPLLKGADHE